LITDSSLPDEVKESEYYVAVDKKQWLDLVDYSEGLVNADPDQKVLFLIVAKGTPEQEAADAERKRQQELEEEERQRKLEEERESLVSQKTAAELELLEKQRAEQEAQERAAREKALLREKSKSIFNALYKR
jgi:dipeptidase